MMDGARIREAKERLADLPTEELLSIYGRHDETEWTPEAFAAIGALLAERGVEAPPPAAAAAEPAATTVTLGQRIGRAWAAHARFDDDQRAQLPEDDQRDLGRSLLSLRAGALLAICIWWLTLVATRPLSRSFLVAPLVVYTLPYLWILVALDRRLVRHAVAVSGTVGWVVLAFLSLNSIAMGLLATRRAFQRLPMLMVAGNVAAFLPHGMMFLGAVFAAKAMGPARPGIPAWLFTLGLFVLYVMASTLVLRYLLERMLKTIPL